MSNTFRKAIENIIDNRRVLSAKLGILLNFGGRVLSANLYLLSRAQFSKDVGQEQNSFSKAVDGGLRTFVRAKDRSKNRTKEETISKIPRFWRLEVILE